MAGGDASFGGPGYLDFNVGRGDASFEGPGYLDLNVGGGVYFGAASNSKA